VKPRIEKCERSPATKKVHEVFESVFSSEYLSLCYSPDERMEVIERSATTYQNLVAEGFPGAASVSTGSGVAWNQEKAEILTAKMLNVNSLWPLVHGASLLCSEMGDIDGTVNILEMGTGVGLATVAYYKQAKERYPDQEVHIVSVDDSLSSIAIACQVLALKGINVEVVDSLAEVAEDFDGVSIVVDNFKHVSTSLQESGEVFHGGFSNYGLSYLEPRDFQRVHTSLKASCPDMPFIMDSLDPNVTIEIDKFDLILAVLSDRFANKQYDRYMNSNGYVLETDGEQIIIRGMWNEIAMSYYNFLRKLRFVKFLTQYKEPLGQTIMALDELRANNKSNMSTVGNFLYDRIKLVHSFQKDEPEIELPAYWQMSFLR